MTTVFIGVLAAVLMTACGGDGGGGGGGGSECTATTDLNMVDNAFEPTCLQVSEGDTINLTNEGVAVHSFTVESAGIDVDVQAGESSTAALEGVGAGTIAFTCTFHPEMTGTLEVG